MSCWCPPRTGRSSQCRSLSSGAESSPWGTASPALRRPPAADRGWCRLSLAASGPASGLCDTQCCCQCWSCLTGCSSCLTNSSLFCSPRPCRVQFSHKFQGAAFARSFLRALICAVTRGCMRLLQPLQATAAPSASLLDSALQSSRTSLK